MRNADTKAVVATMDIDDGYAGELVRRRASRGASRTTHGLAGDGRPISPTAIDDDLRLFDSTAMHASFLAFVGFVIAMKYASDDMLLVGVDLSPDEGTASSSSGVTAGDVIDVAGAIRSAD